GWTSSPNGRGTQDIIWSCVFTIFLCVWTVLTLNVPAKGTSQWRVLRTKLKWMAIAIFGPECLSIIAGAQWSIARRSVQEFKAIGVKWTMHQAFFADMGGIRIKPLDEKFPVTSRQLLVLVKRDLVIIDTITPETIDDKSKTDGFTKLFTVLQTAWFILQSLARIQQNLDLTTLELSTIAFIVCSFATNIIWVVSPMEKFDNLRPSCLEDMWLWLPGTTRPSQDEQKLRLRNDRLPPFERDWFLTGILFSLCLCFGSVYVAAWNINTPTEAEQIIWRICIVSLMSLVFLYWVIDMIFFFTPYIMNKKKTNVRNRIKGKEPIPPVQKAIVALGSLVYISVRLCILIEPLVAMRSLSTTAFDTVNWTLFIPHI
ncbi:hypothetical protein BDZ45DRAFT_552164, partial [Acephala macrosclerotiorum]